MRVVVIESPYKAICEYALQRNLAYARALVEHVTLRGDAPVASHLLITQALDDRIPEHRKLGIDAGLALLRVADIHAFGIDLGISGGMRHAMETAKAPMVDVGRPAYEEISLPEWREAMAADINPQHGFDMLDGLVRKYQPKWHVHTG